jgi:hypothetical protein
VYQPESIALAEGAMWLLRGFEPTPRWNREHRGFIGPLFGGTTRVYRVDPGTFELLTRPLVLPGDFRASGTMATGYGALWIPRGHDLLRIDAHAGGPSHPPFYADAQAVAEALQARGVCRGFSDIVDSERLPGESLGRCTVTVAPVHLFAFADPSWLDRGLRPIDSPYTIVGTNWIASTSNAQAAEAVHRALGGTETGTLKAEVHAPLLHGRSDGDRTYERRGGHGSGPRVRVSHQ